MASELARAETVRAARRAVSAAEDLARAALTAVTLVPITASIIETAATLDPPLLRTLDAIHLATALLIQDELEAVVTYDERLADAARAHGLAVAAPF